MNHGFVRMAAATLLAVATLAAQPAAQPVAQPGRGGRGPQVTSPQVTEDRKVVFRILAPNAQAVRVSGGDIPGNGQGTPAVKGENGIWEATLGPVEPGAYRYNFNVDGVAVIDPRNPSTSESNTNVWSLVYVPGSDMMDTAQVPHGAVAAVPYYSTALGRFRRMHVYTPPGYESGGREKYPVFYLLHGAGDSDDSWTSVGRAGFILDNLIAAKKAKPMLIVMPAGHTGPFSFIMPTAPAKKGGGIGNAQFADDFLKDIVP